MTKHICKCAICNIQFDTNSEPHYVLKYGKRNRYIHLDCKNKLVPNISDKEEIDKILKETIVNPKKGNGAKDNIGNDKDKFVTYIKDKYQINSFSKYEYVNFTKIVNGTYKDLKVGISYAELLEMFQLKEGYLVKVYQNNIRKGKHFNNDKQRFYYDLAIIINKYDGYKKWKAKQEIYQKDVISKIEEDNKEKIDYSKIVSEPQIDNVDTDDLEIDDIIDDLY